jgi:hypothetical protein
MHGSGSPTELYRSRWPAYDAPLIRPTCMRLESAQRCLHPSYIAQSPEMGEALLCKSSNYICNSTGISKTPSQYLYTAHSRNTRSDMFNRFYAPYRNMLEFLLCSVHSMLRSPFRVILYVVRIDRRFRLPQSFEEILTRYGEIS